AARARHLKNVREVTLVRVFLEDRERRVADLLVLVLQQGDGEARGHGGAAFEAHLADGLQGPRTHGGIRRGEHPARDVEGRLGGKLPGEFESGEAGEVVAAGSDLLQKRAELRPSQLLQEAHDGAPHGLRARLQERKERFEPGAVVARAGRESSVAGQLVLRKVSNRPTRPGQSAGRGPGVRSLPRVVWLSGPECGTDLALGKADSA